MLLSFRYNFHDLHHCPSPPPHHKRPQNDVIISRPQLTANAFFGTLPQYPKSPFYSRFPPSYKYIRLFILYTPRYIKMATIPIATSPQDCRIYISTSARNGYDYFYTSPGLHEQITTARNRMNYRCRTLLFPLPGQGFLSCAIDF